MAKVSGPLMSMDARGKFGGTLVFSGWKGRPTVRQLVTPANPKSLNQVGARNMVRVTGAVQHQMNLDTRKRSGETVRDKAELTTLAPAGQAWNGFLVKSIVGAGQLNYTAARAAYAILTAPQKTAWDTAAGTMVPAISAVAQQVTGGAAGTPITAGEVHYIGQCGLFHAGAAAALPTATPPTYA